MFVSNALLVGALSIAACATASADTFSFQGDFAADDDVQLFTFSVITTSSVTLQSFSYAGGTQGDGTEVDRGGFDPILALFDSLGNLIDQNDDGAGVPQDPLTGASFDTLLMTSLAPGLYTVSIMQYNNFANGPNLSDGFAQSGNPFFTGDWCSNGQFCDVSNVDPHNNRTNSWAFDISGVNTAAVVPIPAAAPLLGSAMALLGYLGVWRRRTV